MLDDFLAKYRKGDIVYPSAVARYSGNNCGKSVQTFGRAERCVSYFCCPMSIL